MTEPEPYRPRGSSLLWSALAGSHPLGEPVRCWGGPLEGRFAPRHVNTVRYMDGLQPAADAYRLEKLGVRFGDTPADVHVGYAFIRYFDGPTRRRILDELGAFRAWFLIAGRIIGPRVGVGVPRPERAGGGRRTPS